MQAPINATRAQALHTLDAWFRTKSYTLSAAVRAAIEKLRATEVNSDNITLLNSLAI